jgi:hypothetical protein
MYKKYECVETCFDSPKSKLYVEGVYDLDEATVKRFKTQKMGFIAPDEPFKDEKGNDIESDPHFIPLGDARKEIEDMSKAELRAVARAMGFEIDGAMSRELILEMIVGSSHESEERDQDVAIEARAPIQAPTRRKAAGNKPSLVRETASNQDPAARKAKAKPGPKSGKPQAPKLVE